MITGANAPLPGQDGPDAGMPLPSVPREACQDNFILSLQFDQRLWLLREQAVAGARKAETMTTIGAILSLLVCAAFTVLTLISFVGLTIEALRTSEVADSPEALVVDLLVIASLLMLLLADAYFIITLRTVKRLFDYHYQLSWREMVHGDQAQLFAAEELHKILANKITDATLLKLSVKHKHQSFGQMLQYCACHILQLRKLARNPEARLSASALIRGQQVLIMQSLFQMPLPSYWVIAMAVLVLFNLALPAALVCVIMGPSYIISRSVLVAFYDFLLEQPTIRLETLAAPDPAPKTWWQRIVAPLKR